MSNIIKNLLCIPYYSLGGLFIPRIKLQELPKYKFKFNRTIHEDDLNYANHLGNDSLVHIIQEAHIQLIHELGYSELDLGDNKTGIIIGDLAVNFKAEGFLGEELLIESQPGEITTKGFRIYHRISRYKDKKLLALVETGLIAFDYKERNPVELPEDFRKILEI